MEKYIIEHVDEYVVKTNPDKFICYKTKSKKDAEAYVEKKQHGLTGDIGILMYDEFFHTVTEFDQDPIYFLVTNQDALKALEHAFLHDSSYRDISISNDYKEYTEEQLQQGFFFLDDEFANQTGLCNSWLTFVKFSEILDYDVKFPNWPEDIIIEVFSGADSRLKDYKLRIASLKENMSALLQENSKEN